MKVVVRVRPYNTKESDTRSVVKVIDEQLLIFDPKEETDDFFFQGLKQRHRDVLRKPNKDMQFVFDRVFDGDVTNAEVYEHTTMSVLDGLLDGYNCSVFAYGATGAGKTYTMLGSPESPGITFLTMMELFRRIELIKNERTVEVAVSYLEVYNENIRDLFAPTGHLQICEDPQRGVVVNGLKLHKPQCAEELLDMLHSGNRRRTQHPTDANAESSRSHAIFTVYVKQQERSGRQVALRSRLAKMSLIDLAGSERATMLCSNSNKGSRMREGANINKSLLALGNCINALAGRTATSKAHIPYRNSKLTRLLKDSLDGNCCTVMIAAVGPSLSSFDDTYNTLKYADRAKNIKLNVKQNVVNNELHIAQYLRMIEELRAQVAQLKAALQLTQGSNHDLAPVPGQEPGPVPMQSKPLPDGSGACQVAAATGESEMSPDVAELKLRLQAAFGERRDAQRDYLRVVSQMRELELRIHRRLRKVDSLAVVSVDAGQLERRTSKADQAVQSLRHRLEVLVARKTEMERRILESQERLEALGVDNLPKVLQDWVKAQRLEIVVKNQKHQNRHLRRLAVVLDREEGLTNQLVSGLLRVVRRQYAILKANGIATCDVEEDYSMIVRQVEGCKGVAWADLQAADDPDATDKPAAASTVPNFAEILDLPLLSITAAVENDLKGCRSTWIQSTPLPSQADPGAVVYDGSHVKTAFRKLKLEPTPPRRKSPRLNPPSLPGADMDATFDVLPSPPHSSPVVPQEAAEDECNLTFTAPSLANSKQNLPTSDAPGPSILKTMQVATPVNRNLKEQQQPPRPTDSARLSASVSKGRSLKQLGPAFCDTGLRALENLRKHGFPSVVNKLEGPVKSVPDEKKKVPWKINGFKLHGTKRWPRPHPYQIDAPRRAQVAENGQSASAIPAKKLKMTTAVSAENLMLSRSTSYKRLPLPIHCQRPAVLSRLRSQSTSNMTRVPSETSNKID